jgi:hypothetical protein
MVFSQNDNISKIYTTKFRETRTYFELRLPYQIKRHIKRVFDEDTPYAIKIVEMKLNGSHVPLIFNGSLIESRGDYDTRRTSRGEIKYFLAMYWHIMPDKILWSDERESLVYEINRNSTGCLEIHYRVVYPFPFMTLRKLYNKNIPRNYLSDEYIAIVELPSHENM